MNRFPNSRALRCCSLAGLLSAMAILVAGHPAPIEAATFTVTDAGDSGPGTLRNALEASNANPGPDAVLFAIIPGGPQSIVLLSALPPISEPIVIDGTSQPGYAGAPLVTLDASGVGVGLFLYGASGSAVRGIAIANAQNAGIALEGVNDSVIEDVVASWTGPDAEGVGVSLYQSSRNTVRRVTATGRYRGISTFFADGNLIRDNLLSGADIGIRAGGIGNRFFGNDLSGAAAFALSIVVDTRFEIAGNDFRQSANGLHLDTIDGLVASPASGPGQISIDVSEVAGAGLFVEGVRNSHVSGLDLSWGGATCAGRGIFVNGGSANTWASITARQRLVGFEMNGGAENRLMDLDLGWSGAGQQGVGVSLYQTRDCTIERVVSINRQTGVSLFFTDRTLVRDNRLGGAATAILSGGQGNRFFGNDLSRASGTAIYVTEDRALEMAGNDLSHSANGLHLFNIDGLVASPEPGPGQVSIEVGTVPGVGLMLTAVRNSRLTGLDLSWTGANDAGWPIAPDWNRGLSAHDCSGTVVDSIQVRNRRIGVALDTRDLRLECSRIRDNGVGIRIDNAAPSGLVIRGCDIAGNLDAGLLSLASLAPVDAEGNYWGGVGGPAPAGSGDRVQGNADVIPFLIGPSGCAGGNHPPVLESVLGPSTPVVASGTVEIVGSFTDPDPGDLHQALIDWGDGTTSDGVVTYDAGTGAAGGFHAYPGPGVYTVRVTVTDVAGASDQAAFQYVVIYDPNGGFVTGGGWINSPAGAYAADPLLGGRANFGFVAKYRPGAQVPTGHTEFQFKAGDLNFRSDSYEWLVVAGAKAKYRGRGTINGAGEYRFQLTATDGQAGGGGGTDRFRIRIWDAAGGGVIYDNQPGAPDDADATTALAGGSIVIHRQ